MGLTCKLCGGSSEKLAKAHIIPKAFYGSTLTSTRGSARLISNAPFARSPRSPVGEYDAELICSVCESYFASLDGYAYWLMFLDKPRTYFDHGIPILDVHSSYDAESFRQFILSLLWRMETTSRPAFSHVRLGMLASGVEESMRQRNSRFAPFVDAIIQRFDDPRSDPILFPTRQRHDGVNGYRVKLARHAIWIKTDRRPIPSTFSDLSVSSGPILPVLRMEFSESPEFRALIALLRLRQRGS